MKQHNNTSMSKYYKNRIMGMGAWVVAFLFLCLPVAWGQETEEIEKTFYMDAEPVVIEEAGTYRITQLNPEQETGNTITVRASVKDVTIHLKDVNIKSDFSTFDIGLGASVNLILEGVNKLTTTYWPNPALRCESKDGTSTSLTIDGTGELIATGSGSGAGIGSGSKNTGGTSPGGNIMITGGVVTATSTSGAGIGGGTGGTGGNVTITGGVVTATSTSGAGIGGGGGSLGDGGIITITGGVVMATSTYGAGIGKGDGNGAAGTFSAAGGNAFIIASSISDNSSTDDWSGVIFQGNDGQVYGSPKLPEGVITIPADKTLKVESGKTFTIEKGTTLIVENGARITNDGTIENNGVLAVDGTLTKGGDSSPEEELGNLYKLANGTINGYLWEYGVRITFDGNGGSVATLPYMQVVEKDEGEVVKPTGVPLRAGYTFAWWSEGADSRVEAANWSNIGTDKTYYAVWKYNPIISFEGVKEYTYGEEIKITATAKIWKGETSFETGAEVELSTTPSSTNAGPYTVEATYTPEGDDDYNTVVTKEVTYTINARDLTLTIPKQELYQEEEPYYTTGDKGLINGEKPTFTIIGTDEVKISEANIDAEGEGGFLKSNYAITFSEGNDEVTVKGQTLAEAYAAETKIFADKYYKEEGNVTLKPSPGFKISTDVSKDWKDKLETTVTSSSYSFFLKHVRCDGDNDYSNVSGEQELVFKVDKTAPTITIKQLDGLNVSVTINDDESGVASYTYQWDNDGEMTENLTESPIQLTAPSYGMHTLTVTATDKVGNTSNPASQVFTFEEPLYTITLAPNITGGTISADPAEAAAGETVTLYYTEHTNYDFAGWTVTETGGGETVSVKGNNTFIMPAYAVTVSARFRYNPPYVPEPTPVYYTVTLPAVEGATTDPVAGEYEVESWGSFGFYLTLAADYDQSKPVVSTSRGETIEPRASDGKYVIRYVRSDLEIRIDGIQKNPDPVANERIEAEIIEVRGGEGCLYLRLGMRREVYVYTFTGSLIRRFDAAEGDSRWTLPKGNYIVQIDGKSYKVAVW